MGKPRSRTSTKPAKTILEGRTERTAAAPDARVQAPEAASTPPETVEQRLEELLRRASELMPTRLRAMTALAESRGELQSTAGKQALARALNAECRRHGQVLIHPETGDPCVVLAINDGARGRFVLENSITKKRSHTTKDPADLPLRTRPMPAHKPS